MKYLYNADSDFQKELDRLMKKCDELNSKASEVSAKKDQILTDYNNLIHNLETLQNQNPGNKKLKISAQKAAQQYLKIQNLLKK